MFPLMRTLSTTNTQHPSSNPPTKQVPSNAHFINTQHSTPITQQTCSPRCALHQHPTLNTHHPSNMFPLMRTLSTTNTQHPSPVKHVPSDAHFINTQHSTPITQQTCSLRCALHQHLTLNTHRPTNMFPQMRTHQHPTLNTHHPIFITQHPSKAPHTLRDNTLHLSANTTG